MAVDNRANVQRLSHDPNLKKGFYSIEQEIDKEQYFNNTNSVLVCMGLPKVNREKYSALIKKVIVKHFRQQGVSWDDDIRDFYMPINGYEGEINEDDLPPSSKEKGKGWKTLGMFFVEFNNEEMARKVKLSLDGEPIAKKSTWQILFWSDWLESEKIEEEFVQPSFDDFKSTDSTRAWLEDFEARDQFMIRWKEAESHKCSVYWGDHRRGGAEFVTDFASTLKKENKDVLTSAEAEWSSKGSYIITKHNPGMRTLVQNRTGEWIEHRRFIHDEVDFWDFSPCEKFLTTWSSENKSAIQFWDVETGQEGRPFDSYCSDSMGVEWPFFKWSYDDQYFAWIQSSKLKSKDNKDITMRDADKITIYTSKDYKRVKGGSFEAKDIKVIEFCPTQHLLAYVTFPPDQMNENPTSINILTVPGKELKISYPQVSVHRVNLFWHNSGDYLCACVLKRKKRKKKKREQCQESDSASLLVFHCRERNFPRIIVDLGKDKVAAVAWEPNDSKLCVLQDKTLGEFVITIFEFGYDKNFPVQFRIFNNPSIPNPTFHAVDDVFWSPMGRYMCLSHTNGKRTFFDTNTLKRPRGKNREKVHDSAEEPFWSPCGRFLVSTVCSPLRDDDGEAMSTDNAVVMYNFQGDEIARMEFKGAKGGAAKCLFSFAWRPRPKSLVTEEMKQDIQKRLKKQYWEEFSEADKKITLERSSKKKKEMFDREQDWKTRIDGFKAKAAEIRKRREEIRGGRMSEDESEFDWEECEEEQRIASLSTEILLTAEELELLMGSN